MANWVEEHENDLRSLGIDPKQSAQSDDRPCRHGEDYGGSYRADIENPPRRSDDTRDTED